MVLKPLMKRVFAGAGITLYFLFAAGSVNFGQQTRRAVPSRPAPAADSGLMPVEARKALIQQYCQGCHNDQTHSGGMTLTAFDPAHAEQNPELAEKIVKKLKTGLMPPAIAPKRPDRESALALVKAIETQVDRAAALHPNAGTRPFQRLTRDEYARSVRELLGINIDVEKFLPADTLSEGLDNIADTQAFSASLMEGYIRAAAQVSREALGDPNAEAASSIFKVNRTGAQLRHIEGAPFGTRGGLAITFNFPADGEYNFRALLH